MGNTLLLAAAFGAACWWTVRYVERATNERLQGELHAFASMLAKTPRAELQSPEDRPPALQPGWHVEAFPADATHMPRPRGASDELTFPVRLIADARRDGTANTTIVRPHQPGMSAVAVRGEGGLVVAVAAPRLRVSSLATFWRMLVLPLALIGLSAMAILLLGSARLWNRPLHRIVSTARNLSRGDLSARADFHADDELGLLARALNRMRDRLVAHVDTIDRQRRMLEALLQQVHEGVIAVDDKGHITLINPAAVRLLNIQGAISGSELVGMAVERCIAHHPLQRMLVAPNELPEQEPGGRAVELAGTAVWESRIKVDSADGPVHLLAHASDLTLPQVSEGEPGAPVSTGRLAVLTDITALTRTLQIKTDFVQNASHELRTPLSTIRAAIETLQKMDLAEDDTAARRFLEVIDRQSGRLEAMASDLLELARLESDASRFPGGPIQIEPLLDELDASFRHRAEARGVSLTITAPSCAGREVVVNTRLLRLVLDNLLDNAIKYTPDGGAVRVECVCGTRCVTLEVSDTGIGIPSEDRERVFERFYQVERARSGRVRGTGLGLSIVRHAVGAMNGTVELQSTPGKGTRIRVSLPQPAS